MTCNRFATIVLAGLLTAACGSEHSAETAAPTAASPAPATSAELTAPAGDPAARIEIAVTAEQLFAGYAENEVAADAVYRQSDLRVSGTVEAVQLDMMDDPVVLLAGDGFMHVQARGLPRDDVMRLRKGDQVALLCIGSGASLGSPMLAECSIDAADST